MREEGKEKGEGREREQRRLCGEARGEGEGREGVWEAYRIGNILKKIRKKNLMKLADRKTYQQTPD